MHNSVRYEEKNLEKLAERIQKIHSDAYYEKQFEEMKLHRYGYIHAPFGWDKSLFVKGYLDCLEEQNYTWTQWEQGMNYTAWEKKICSSFPPIVVLSNLERLMADNNLEDLIRFITAEKRVRQFVLISSVDMPQSLIPFRVFGEMFILGKNELKPSREEVELFFAGRDIYLNSYDYQKIEDVFNNMPLMIRLLPRRISEAGTFNNSVVKQCCNDAFSYFDVSYFRSIPLKYQNIFFKLCYFNEIDMELFEKVLGYSPDESAEISRNIIFFGSFLERGVEDGIWVLNPFARRFLRHFFGNYIQNGEMDTCYERAISFYMDKEKYLQVLIFASILEKWEIVADVLKRLLPGHVSVVNYLELEEYIESLPMAYVRYEPKLVAARAMLASILCQKEEAMVWYLWMEKLSADKENPELAAEAKKFLYYLFIAMPGVHEDKFLESTPKIAAGMLGNGLKSFDIVITSNMPSVVHGGRDFTNYVPKYREMIVLTGKILHIILGKRQAGFLYLVDGEVNYEQNHLRKALDSVTKGLTEAKKSENLEMVFAGNCILSYIYLAYNRESDVRAIWESTSKYLEEHAVSHLLGNMEAFLLNLELINGDTRNINRWLDQALSEYERFYTMNRYLFLVKTRVYIEKQEYFKAYTLLLQLTDYAVDYKMYYLQIETSLLMAITVFRAKKDNYIEHLERALSLGKRYKVERVFAMEGAALLPIMEELKARKDMKKDASFQRVYQSVEEFAKMYPNYLKRINKDGLLTEMENDVIKLVAEGCRNNEIAKRLIVSENTVKYHLKNIYGKLNVKNRAEAAKVARERKYV